MGTFERFGTLIVLLVCTSGTALAQPTAETPQFKVGDSWTFARIDGFKNERTGSFTHTVAAVTSGHVQMDTKTPSRVLPSALTSEGNFVEAFGTKNSPHYSMLSFPLSVGKKWEAKYDWSSSSAKGSGENTVEVVAVEKVVVPAGTFEAFKLRYSGTYTVSGFPGLGRKTSTYWYAPTARQIIRAEYSSTDTQVKPYHRWINELESYKVVE